MDRVYSLRDNRAEEHLLPNGSAIPAHRIPVLPRRPKVTQATGWWKVTVEHYVAEPDDGVNWQEWDDLKEWMDNRRR